MTTDQEYLLSPSLRALLLLIWSVVLAMTGWDFYLLGHYSGVLWLLLMIPIWLLQGLWLLIRQGSARSLWLDAVCIFSIVITVLYLWYLAPDMAMAQVVVLPAMVFFLLPGQYGHQMTTGLSMFLLIVVALMMPDALEVAVCVLMMSLFVGIGHRMLYAEHEYRSVRSLRDALSGACNARFLRESLQREVARCALTGGDVSLVGLAIDEYQQLQQSHAPHELQQLYQGIVRQIRTRIRRVDEVFRLDDDIWVVMLPDCQEDAELVLREALSRQLEETEWEHIQQLSLTACGVTLSPGETPDDVLKRLQMRLNKQKQGHMQAAAFRL